MNVPKLRFKEFNDTWKKIQLSSFVNINPQNDSLPEKFIYIDLESVNNGLLTSRKIINRAEAPSRAKRTIIKNDILYQTVRPYQMNNLFINSLDSDYPYIASTGYALLRTKENPYFVYSILHQKSFVNKVLDMCTGTSYPAINATDLGKISVGLPSIKEQEKISRTLELLDKKIELQTKKIEDLKLFKKGLNKFVFSNCTDEYKIENLIIEYSNKTTENNQYEVLSSTANGITFQNEYFNKQAASNNNTGYKIIPKGFITYRSMSDTGKFHFNIQDITDIGIVSPAYPVFNIKKNLVNKTYFVYYINENDGFKNEILSTKEGGTRYALSITKFKTLNILLPKIEEQIKYSKYINIIINKIQLEEKKLEKLIQLKKGLMQNMFV